MIQYVKDVSLRTGLLRQTLFEVYPYMYEPHQLEFFLSAMREIKDVPGACVEVGCARGATTVFLNRYLRHLGVNKRYIAIDTFSGFVPDDIAYEAAHRSKDDVKRAMEDDFILNRRAYMVESLRLRGLDHVEVVEADGARYDYRAVGDIAFCLIDVDLYKPVAAVLPMVYAQLSPGGMIVVDDCQPHPKWDGALDAYQEFAQAQGLAVDIVCDKLGLIRKPAAQHAEPQALSAAQMPTP